MKFLKNTFPENNINKDNYDLIPISKTTKEKQNRNTLILFLIIFYILCFGLGTLMYTYHSKFIHSGLYFVIFLLLSFVIIVPIHLFLHILVYPGGLNDDNTYLGFDKNRFNFYALYNKSLSRNRHIISILLPFFIISIPSFIILIFYLKTMLLYAIFCANTLLCVFDFYDLFFLLFKVDKDNKKLKIIKVENSFFMVKKNI